MKRWLILFKRAIEECIRDNTPMLAAGLSFYTLLSIAPALWLLVAVVGVWVGRDSARQRLIGWTTEVAGPRVAEVVGAVADQVEASGTVVTVLGLVTVFFGATMVFGALHDALNRIWNVAPRPPSIIGTVRGYFTKRLLAFGGVLLVGFLILLSVVAETVMNAAARFAPGFLPVPWLLWAANIALSMVVIVLFFAGIYRYLHAGNQGWREVWVGALVTAVLFEGGKILIGLYLGKTSLTSVYGAAGSLVVLLLWVYYSAQIFLFGAELTEVYAHSRRNAQVKVVPEQSKARPFSDFR